MTDALERAGVRQGMTAAAGVALSTGFPDLDRCLEGGGWPAGTLIELRATRVGIGEMGLLLPFLSAVSRSGRLLWVAPPYKPCALTLTARHVTLDHLVVVRPRTHKEALWTVSEGLLSPAVGAVVTWFTDLREREFRALQRQAAEGGQWGFCFLPRDHAAQPARLRLILEPVPRGVRVIFARQAGRPAGPLTVTI